MSNLQKIEKIKFQFLMVRLKDYRNTNKKNLKIVSIPYGSIKSAEVRASEVRVSGFNSLWFD